MDLEQFIETLSEQERQHHRELTEELRLRNEETRKSRQKKLRQGRRIKYFGTS